MGFNQLIALLVTVTVVEMMLATGPGVRPADVIRAARTKCLVMHASLANYVAVPSAAVLLALVDADPMTAAGILILAACPGVPFSPLLTALGRGNTLVAVGLMVILAGTSVVMAPLLLLVLQPLTNGDASLHVERLMDIRLGSIMAMLILLGGSLGVGWYAGRHKDQDRRAAALTTSIRHVGLGLVIATSTFTGTSTITTVMIYSLLQLLISLLLALWWRRGTSLINVQRSGRPDGLIERNVERSLQ